MIPIKFAIFPAAACLLLASALPAAAQRYTTTTVTTTTTYGAPYVVDETLTPGIISMDAARADALAAEPGRIANSSLFVNDAGLPVYVFDIRNGDMSHIVRISALTGQVVGRDTINRRSGYFHRPFSALNSDED